MVENWMDYRRLVGAVAKRLARPGVTAEELFVAGLWGLYQAARSFDPERGLKFATHARVRVTGEMKDFKKATYGNNRKHALTGRIPAGAVVRDRDLAAVDARDELEAAIRAGVTVPRRANCEQFEADGMAGRRLSYGGVSLTMLGWAKRIGVTQSAMSERIKKWGVERAISTPKQKPGRRRRVG